MGFLKWSRIRDLLQPRSDSRSPAPLEIGHVLFMDVIGFSLLPIERQAEVLDQLQKAVASSSTFQRSSAKRQMISLPTGDGMALVFFNNPTSAATCALEVARALQNTPEVKLRMGVHTGLVYRVADINANRNVVGGGINMAQRVMSCGGEGHILISQPVAEVLSQLEYWQPHIHDIGEYQVKHRERIRLFNLYTGELGQAEAPTLRRLAQAYSPGPLRFYVYISAAKVNLLLSQSATAGQDLGVPSGDVGYDDKEALINALNAAIAILKRNEYVGTVDQPKRWIEGRASLQHGIIGDDPMDIALFGGHVGETMLALIGSSESLIGATRVSGSNHTPLHYTLSTWNRLLKDGDGQLTEKDQAAPERYDSQSTDRVKKSMQRLLNTLPPFKTELEFLALVLHQGEHLVLATPIFVSFAT